jgi:predicted RNase H-like HicB family nuclease
MKKDWSKLYKKYKGMWVALAPDETTVLGVGKTVKEAVAKAQKKSAQTPFLMFVPRTLDAYVGAL